jgi:hypothetical protein
VGGTPGVPQPTLPAPFVPQRSRGRTRLLSALILPVVLAVGVGFLVFRGGSCSSVEGRFVAQGAPLGTFTFVPAQCKSGQRMQIHGAVLVGKGPTEGGVMVFEDPTKGKLVKVELPGSCKPPDYEICTEVILDPKACSTYKVQIVRTNTTVNDIRLMDGKLALDCKFPEGGTATANLTFSSCD